MKAKIKRIHIARKRLNQAQTRLIKARLVTEWIVKNKHIHALNYLYYRYFTNSFERFLINKINGD